MKYNLYIVTLMFTVTILAILGYVFVKLETFVNSTLLISILIIRTSHIPLHIEGSSWFSHANTLKNYPGSMLLLSTYSIITDLTPLQVINLPILLPITVIFAYMLSRIASSKPPFLLAYLGFIFFYIVNTLDLHTISYHSLGYIYYLIYLYLIFLLVYKEKINTQNLILMIIISVISIITYYFTSTLIILTSLSIATLLTILHRKKQHNTRTLYSALLLSFVIGVIGEIIYSRKINTTEFNFMRLQDLLQDILHVASVQIKKYETVLFINELAKTIYLNARTIVLSMLSSFYMYYINGLIILFSIAMILGVFPKAKKYPRKPNSLLLLYIALFIGSVLHALLYFVTYGTLGTRAYMYFVLPFSPIVFMHLINEIPISLRHIKVSIRRLLIFIYIFFLLSSFVGSVHSYIFIGYVGGYTRSSNIESIKTLPEAILLSNVLESSITVITDYPRSQYVYQGFILHDKVGDVRPYLGKHRVLVNATYPITSLTSVETIYNILEADALLIAADNFNRLVYGDITAYIAPPFDYVIMDKLIRLSSKVYSSTRLTLIIKP